MSTQLTQGGGVVTVNRKLQLSQADIRITRREGEERIGLDVRRKRNVNWHWITLSPDDVKALIADLITTL